MREWSHIALLKNVVPTGLASLTRVGLNIVTHNAEEN